MFPPFRAIIFIRINQEKLHPEIGADHQGFEGHNRNRKVAKFEYIPGLRHRRKIRFALVNRWTQAPTVQAISLLRPFLSSCRLLPQIVQATLPLTASRVVQRLCRNQLEKGLTLFFDKKMSKKCG
jgi:hypothetical protein